MKQTTVTCPLHNKTQTQQEWAVRSYTLDFNASSKFARLIEGRCPSTKAIVDCGNLVIAMPAHQATTWGDIERIIESTETEVNAALEIIGTIEFLNAATLTSDPLAVRLLEVLAAKTDTEVQK